MPSTGRVTLGVDQPLFPGARLRVTYLRQDGRNLFRSRDANAPDDGARPDRSAASITQLETTAKSRNQSLELAFIVSERLKREREGRPEPEISIAAGE